MTNFEKSGDESFIASNTNKVHRGTQEDGPECGARQKDEWASVDAGDEEEAVMDYNLSPCLNCIMRPLTLSRWRRMIHGPSALDRDEVPTLEDYV